MSLSEPKRSPFFGRILTLLKVGGTLYNLMVTCSHHTTSLRRTNEDTQQHEVIGEFIQIVQCKVFVPKVKKKNILEF